MWKAPARLGLSLKKSLHAAEADRPDVVQARAAWVTAQPALLAPHLLFVDETGASTKMTPLRGRSAIGSLPEQFSTADCERYIHHCGYAQSA